MRILDEEFFQGMDSKTTINDTEIERGKIRCAQFTEINKEILDFLFSGEKTLIEYRKSSSKQKHCHRKLEFFHCTFPDIDISGKCMEEDIIFHECFFQGSVNCNKTEFKQNITFDGSVFKGEVNFKEAVFHKIASFRDIHLLPSGIFNCYGNLKKRTEQHLEMTKMFFHNAHFDGPVDFQYFQFPQFTSFEKACFNSYFVFEDVDFRSGTVFSGVRYGCVHHLDKYNLDPIQLQVCFGMLRKSAEKAGWRPDLIENIKNIEKSLDKYNDDFEYKPIRGKIYTSNDNPCLPSDKGFIRKDAVLKYTGWREESLDVIASKHPDNFKRFRIGNVLYFEVEPLREFFAKKNNG